MATGQELQVQQKREVEKKQESTVPARVYVPVTDIFETNAALMLALEMPGVDRENINVKLDSGVLTIEGELLATQFLESRSITHKPLTMSATCMDDVKLKVRRR